MAYETLIYEKQDKIAVITLNRPECLNAFNNISFQDIKAAIIKAGDDSDIRVIVLKGSERAFSAGDDIKYMTSGAVTDGDVWTALMQECVGEISRCKKPVIAAVSGVGCARNWLPMRTAVKPSAASATALPCRDAASRRKRLNTCLLYTSRCV